MSLYMESTEVSPTKTAGEITQVLVANGATQVAAKYEHGDVIGLTWSMRVAGNELHFALPVRTEAIYEIFRNRQQTTFLSDETVRRLKAKAARVAWRQLLRWVQAQMAMVDVGMMQPQEIFLPYLLGPSGQTVYDIFAESHFKALPAAKPQ